MSTLPFLLSVADELDNINSQSYMDDFGLGFYPHRTAFHRTPTIQLSLPASTDWTSAIDSRHAHSRYRPHRYFSAVDTTQNNLQSAYEEEDGEGGGGGGGGEHAEDDDNVRHSGHVGGRRGRDERRSEVAVDARRRSAASIAAAAAVAAATAAADADANNLGPSTSTAAGGVATTTATTALNSNTTDNNGGGGGGVGRGGMKVRSVSGGTTRSDVDDDEHIDTTVRMYNLSKKCCKNYYRHAIETGPGAKGVKCTADSNKSSSEESLQKVASPIEFLTCFLVKKSRTPKSVSSSSACSGGSAKKS